MSEFFSFLRVGVRLDLADRERLLSPFLFALTVLLLLQFAFEDVAGEHGREIHVSGIFLTSLFSLQMSFVRMFSPEKMDGVFSYLRAYEASWESWYAAKLLLFTLYGMVLFVPVSVISSIFFAPTDSVSFSSLWLLVGFLAMLGLTSLGVLLSALTLGASSREMLFPLLFFPLSIPVLLSAMQATLIFFGGPGGGAWNWVGILLGFDVIYIVLGFLLFPEVLRST